ncbi:hypothetical protein BaRGS_00013298 [Batillaria attramentaria]|uniref:Uncharacterized protein n=1 Tax=Batillaria attramentaria TaxID=370345 RepID=A0ABD0L6X6_9CAEN
MTPNSAARERHFGVKFVRNASSAHYRCLAMRDFSAVRIFKDTEEAEPLWLRKRKKTVQPDRFSEKMVEY